MHYERGVPLLTYCLPAAFFVSSLILSYQLQLQRVNRKALSKLNHSEVNTVQLRRDLGKSYSRILIQQLERMNFQDSDLSTENKMKVIYCCTTLNLCKTNFLKSC